MTTDNPTRRAPLVPRHVTDLPVTTVLNHLADTRKSQTAHDTHHLPEPHPTAQQHDPVPSDPTEVRR